MCDLGIGAHADDVLASWIWHRKETGGRRFPQAIAHRGYKAQHPENTMEAFKGAIKVGAHAIETDIHLSKDDVVVLSHVGSLNSPHKGILLTPS